MCKQLYFQMYEYLTEKETMTRIQQKPTEINGNDCTSMGQCNVDESIINMRQKMLEEEESMPCFYCTAFGNDEQCCKNLDTVSEDGVRGLGCPRIKKILSNIDK